jgi:hypothetical protein
VSEVISNLINCTAHMRIQHIHRKIEVAEDQKGLTNSK